MFSRRDSAAFSRSTPSGCGGCLAVPIFVVAMVASLGYYTISTSRSTHRPQRTPPRVYSTARSSTSPPPATAVDPNTPRSGVRGTGWLAAKQTIPKFLQCPSTATWPWNTVTVARLPDLPNLPPRYRVTGAVDAQNAFGATVRGWWEVIVLDPSDKFIASKVSLDGTVVFQSAEYERLSGGK